VLAALKLLGGIPLWAWALAALAAWGGFHRWQAIDARRDFQEAKAAAVAEQAASAAAAARETARRFQTVQEAADAATLQGQRDRAAAAGAAAAADRLRARIAAVEAAGRAADPPASGGSAPAGEATRMLSDVLGQCVDRVRRLADYADQARTAGQACERSYDALTPKGSP
jgi:hypothetical protein